MFSLKNVGALLCVLCIISRLAKAEYEDDAQNDFANDETEDDAQDDNQHDVEGRDMVIIKPGVVTDRMIFYTKICNCTCENCDPPDPPPIITITPPPPVIITKPTKTIRTTKPTRPPPPTPPPPPSRSTTKPIRPKSTTKPRGTKSTTKPIRTKSTTKPIRTKSTTKSIRTKSTTKSIRTKSTTKPIRTKSTTKPTGPTRTPPPPSRRTSKPVRTTPRTPRTPPTKPPTEPPPPTVALTDAEIVFIVDLRCGWAIKLIYGSDNKMFEKLIMMIRKFIPKPRFGLTAYGGDKCYSLDVPMTSDVKQIFGAAQQLHHNKINGTQAALAGLFLTATDKRVGWLPGKAEGVPKIIILISDKHIPANVPGGTQPPVGDGTDDCKQIKVPKIERVGQTLRDHGIAVFPLLMRKENYDAWKDVVENRGMGIKLYGGYRDQGLETIWKKLKFTLESENRQKLKR